MKRVALAIVGAAFGLAAGASAQQKDSLPPGVTAAMVTEGEKLFKGAGLCSACHGADAKGMPGVGANLTDSEWNYSKGTYDDIVKQVLSGVPPEKSKTGAVMPPKGGSQLTDAQVKAVAAYVWTLSHSKKK